MTTPIVAKDALAHIELTFGKVVFETETVIVRALEKTTGTVLVVTHEKSVDGHECLPVCYRGGVNYLSVKVHR